MSRNGFALFSIAVATIMLLSGHAAAGEELTPTQQRVHDIYKELVEIDTTTATGDTKRAAEAMAARLKAAGFPEADVQAFSPAPRKGDLVARLHGSGKRKPILLLAHLDVVPALREDWSVDPFKLTEQEGAQPPRRQIHGSVLRRQSNQATSRRVSSPTATSSLRWRRMKRFSIVTRSASNG